MKAIFVGGKFDGQLKDIVGPPPPGRAEYIDSEEANLRIGIYKLADQYTGDNPVYVFQGFGHCYASS